MSPSDQKTLLAELSTRAAKFHHDTDASGNITRLGFSNAKNHEKNFATPPLGVTDEDLARIAELPQLDAIFLERQHKITDAGYAHLAKADSLTDLRIHYPMEAATPNFPACANALHHLRILELKHIFQITAAPSLVLEPRPLLEKLELDTIWSTPAQVDFICANPRVTNLQLHRTTITGADLQRITESLQKIETIELRPLGKGQKLLKPADLAALKNLPNLKNIFLSLHWNGIAYDGGLEHIAAIPSLEFFSLDSFEMPAPESDDIARLRKARPDLNLHIGKTLLPGASSTPNYKAPARDGKHRWGICT